MLHLITWLAIYFLLLFGLGRVIRDWRDRTWFKVLFLPGTLIAVLPQAVASLLCLGGACRVSPIGDRRPTFGVDDFSRIPSFAGALFVLLSHLLFYVLFLVGVILLQSGGHLNAQLVSLPTLYPEQALEGNIQVNLKGYLEGLNALWGYALSNPAPVLCVLYASAGAFSCLRLWGREFHWGLVVVVILGGLLYVAGRFGVGLPFRANLYYIPRWWVLFSFYFTMALLTFAGFGSVRLLSFGWDKVFHRQRRGGHAAHRPAQVEVTV